jgi:anti-sigma factor RsiW
LQGIHYDQTVYDGSPTPVVGRGDYRSPRVTLNERRDVDVREAPGGCPDAEQLAEYADGLLDAAARARIEAHLVTCPDCRAVLVETMAFLGAEAAPLSDPAAAARPADAAPSVGTARPAQNAIGAAPEPTGGPVTPTPRAADVDASATPSPSTGAPARVVPFRTRSWVTGVGGVLAAAAALVLIVRITAPASLPSWLGGRPPFEELVLALDTQRVRPVEGRLMGGFAYKPAPSPTRGGGGADKLGRAWSPTVNVATANIEKFAEGNTSAGARAALGVALIVDGELDAAIAVLEQAAKDSPEEPAIHTNLSAAYLARARWWNHPEDWPKALDAADRAIALDANAPEPYFNRALALEGLEQTERAAQAWADYAARDRHSDWTREAEERRKALSANQP